MTSTRMGDGGSGLALCHVSLRILSTLNNISQYFSNHRAVDVEKTLEVISC